MKKAILLGAAALIVGGLYLGRKKVATVAEPLLPRGLKNNNPGNLKVGTYQRPGGVGRDSKGHWIFETPADGLREEADNVLWQEKTFGNRSLFDLAQHWAPANTGEGNDPTRYAKHLAVFAGVPGREEDPLAAAKRIYVFRDPVKLARLIRAINRAENGKIPYDVWIAGRGGEEAELKAAETALQKRGLL